MINACSADIVALAMLIIVGVAFGIQEYKHKKRIDEINENL